MRGCGVQASAALLAIALGLLLWPARGLAAEPLYWGGTIKGETYGMAGDAPLDPAVLERFEADAGKRVTFINTGQAWASFDRPAMEATIAEGAIPLVTMGLAEGVTLQQVVEGKQDAQIRGWARAAREFGYPFLFRPWWEVNGNWYSWGRDPEFVAAWHHFHDLVEEEGATNVTWDWVVNSIWFDPESDPTPYYPGDEYVDWVGMDAYNWGDNPLQPDAWRSPQEVIGPTLELLEEIAPGKPICICEDASTEIGGDKAAWIREMLGAYLPAHPTIEAYLWFNWNIEQSGGRWDWPIESSPAAEEAFREGIQDRIYLADRPPLRRLGKVPRPAYPPPPPVPPVAHGVSSEETGAAAAPPPAPPPPARLVLARRRARPGNGTARLTLTLPGSGTLRVGGRGFRVGVAGGPLRRAPVLLQGSQEIVLEVGATAATRRLLAASGRARVVLHLLFISEAGNAQRRTVSLTLRGAAASHQGGLPR